MQKIGRTAHLHDLYHLTEQHSYHMDFCICWDFLWHLQCSG